ncbi:hypothetical protein GTA08_BOTSDO05044 [Botryosphaeria dothidea]|uniref:Uncharacterized protein n=1 Tax=Botryosphaeria dothidea TaxID=55169 RepID=A0A8H4IT28_9PEZI|nr:hypothetical protein GTA08_BOTSDO05044 [Botryosphaeria dothidea]
MSSSHSPDTSRDQTAAFAAPSPSGSSHGLYDPDSETDAMTQATAPNPGNLAYSPEDSSDSDESLYEGAPDPRMYIKKESEENDDVIECIDPDSDDEDVSGIDGDDKSHHYGATGIDSGWRKDIKDYYIGHVKTGEVLKQETDENRGDVLGDAAYNFESGKAEKAARHMKVEPDDEDDATGSWLEQAGWTEYDADQFEREDILPSPSSSTGFIDDDNVGVHNMENDDDESEFSPRSSSSIASGSNARIQEHPPTPRSAHSGNSGDSSIRNRVQYPKSLYERVPRDRVKLDPSYRITLKKIESQRLTNDRSQLRDSVRIVTDEDLVGEDHPWDGYPSEANVLYPGSMAKYLKPPDRPQSAPPLVQPVSAFSDSSSDDDGNPWAMNESEAEERAKLQLKLKEEQDKKRQEELEIIKRYWKGSLQRSKFLKPEELRPQTKPKYRERTQALAHLREQRARKDLHGKNMGLDVYSKFHFSGVLSYYEKSKNEPGYPEKTEDKIKWVEYFWQQDHNIMKKAWQKERRQWNEKRKLWAAMWDRETCELTRALEQEKQGSEAFHEENEPCACSRPSSSRRQNSKQPPEIKLSLVFGEPTEISPTSPMLPTSITRNGGPGWQALDTIESIIPEGIATVSPVSPEQPLQILEHGFSENASRSPEKSEPMSPDGPSSGSAESMVVEDMAPRRSDTASDTAKELTHVKELNGVLVKKLAKLQERILYNQAILATRNTERKIKTQKLISAAAKMVEKVQVELLARQIEIISIKRAIGMNVDDVTISLSEISTQMILEPLYPTEELEQKERVREELLENLYKTTNVELDEAWEDEQLRMTEYFLSGGRR